MDATNQLNPTLVSITDISEVLAVGQRVDIALSELSDLKTHDRIAMHLTALEIDAAPGCCAHCALARYLMKMIPELAWVEVFPETLSVHGAIMLRHRTEQLDTSLHQLLADFALLFDTGVYPDLVCSSVCNCWAFLPAS